MVRLSAGMVAKLLPVMLIAVPDVPTVGLKLMIEGAEVDPVTTNEVALTAEPPGAETVIGPVDAPAGTVAVNCVEVAEVTVAAAPLKLTVLLLGVVLKLVP